MVIHKNKERTQTYHLFISRNIEQQHHKQNHDFDAAIIKYHPESSDEASNYQNDDSDSNEEYEKV